MYAEHYVQNNGIHNRLKIMSIKRRVHSVILDSFRAQAALQDKENLSPNLSVNHLLCVLINNCSLEELGKMG